MSRLSATAAGIGGNIALQAVKQVGQGNRPKFRDMLLTPRNMTKLADELARMRGAAMKLGQLISMDAGEMLPPEVASVMARLQNQAHFMPPAQLKQVLNRNWGDRWLRSFQRFDVHPIAAASIGQVHRAKLKDGRDVAIKVQYPGVADSIGSDVSNVGALLKMARVLPAEFDLAPYLVEARKLLTEETEYLREGAHLAHFRGLLADNDAFVLPEFHEDWSTPEILTMSYLEGQPIDQVAELPELERNRVASELIELTLREVFEFNITQSDPNFANYRYDPKSGAIQLLDFGATRELDPALVSNYRKLLKAGLARDHDGLHAAAVSLSLLSGTSEFDPAVLSMIEQVFEDILRVDAFDFTDQRLATELNKQGMELAEAGFVPPPVPMEVLYLQRKFGGMFLLASRLRVNIPLRSVLVRHLA